MEIDASFVGLCHLLVTRDIVDSFTFSKVCSCLLEVERHIGCHALFSDIEHPFIITDASITSRLASDCHLLTPTTEISSEVDIL